MNEYKIEFDLSKKSSMNFELDSYNYVLNEKLKSAVEVAIALQQPLLLTGEPGTGKTRLASKVARDLSDANSNFLQKPIVFNTKTTSTANDLFYSYDAIRHFHDANLINKGISNLKPTEEYVNLQGLGKAIAYADKSNLKNKYFDEVIEQTQSSVVLIDEIDKAHRDFPNDILNEIEGFTFKVNETDDVFSKSDDRRIVIILTSNSEKNLPDAFLRRCIFFHIPFPEEKQLIKIIKAHNGIDSKYSNEVFIEHFLNIRKKVNNKKKPATSELIAWIKMLELKNFIENDKIPDFNKLNSRQSSLLKLSYSILIKNSESVSNK